jgi:MerR family copper efflux transcriptional regulator
MASHRLNRRSSDQGGFAIGEAARAAGISVKMIRHYEAIRLVPAAFRSSSGRRRFDVRAVHTLRFIGRARSLGFSLRAVAELLSLWQDRSRSNAVVKGVAEDEARGLRRKREQLDGMLRALEELIQACAGDGRPDCPILDDLGEGAGGSKMHG